MSDGNAKVVKAGIGYTVGNYMLKGLSFLTVPIFSRLLSPADYGIFNTYLAYQGIAFLLVGLALHTSLKNAKYRYKDSFDQYNSSCIGLMLFSLAAWLVAANLAYQLYGEAIGFSRGVVTLLICDSFGTAMIQFYNVYVGLSYRYTSFLKVSAANAVLSLAISVTLILTVCKNERAVGRIIGNALPVVLIAVVLIASFWKKAKPVLRKEYTKFALGYSLPIIPHGISQVILSQFDRIMIQAMISDEKAGIYSFAYNIFSIINVTASSLDHVWSPWFYEKMEKKDYTAVKACSSYYATGMLLFSVMVMLGTPELVMLLGTEAYRDAAYCVIPIVAGGYFMFLYSLPASVEYYYGKTKFIALGTGIAAVTNIILNLIFIRRFGYVAAAYTTMVTYLLYFLLHYLLAAKIQGSCIYDTKELAKAILCAVAAGTASLLLKPYRYLRWGILLLVFGLTLRWLEKNFQLLTKIKMRGKKEGRP